MRAKFVRGKDPKAALGLGPVTVTLDYHNFYMDEDDPTKPDMSEEDTVYALEQLKDSGLQYEFEQTDWGPVEVTLTGPRDKMAPFVAEYLDEDVDMIRDAMYQWDGKNERDFWKLAGY